MDQHSNSISSILFALGVKVEMVEFHSQREMIFAINRCEKRLKEMFPQVVWSFFEPDVTD